MHRIDNPNAAGALPTPGPVGTPGYFGQGVTEVDADFLNALQEELRNTIVNSPGTPALDKTKQNQLQLAINALIAAGRESLTFQHTETAGTTAGNLTAGTYGTRTINEDAANGAYNDISGASLSSNQITLPAGTYSIRAAASAYNVGEHRIKLRQVSVTAADLIIGLACGDSDTGTAIQPPATLEGRFTLADEEDVEILSITSGGNVTSNAFGLAVNEGSEVECYLTVHIEKIG